MAWLSCDFGAAPQLSFGQLAGQTLTVVFSHTLGTLVSLFGQSVFLMRSHSDWPPQQEPTLEPLKNRCIDLMDIIFK